MQHALDGPVDEVALSYVAYIVTLYQIKNLAEAFEGIKFIGGFLGRLFCVSAVRYAGKRRGNANEQKECKHV